MEKHIIVTSKGQDPSDFVSYFGDILNASENKTRYEIALKEIFHAPVFNITFENNWFELHKSDLNVNKRLMIPIGFYENNLDILNAIYETLEEEIDSDGDEEEGNDDVPLKVDPKLNYRIDDDGATLELDRKSRWEFVTGRSSPLLRSLGYAISKNISKISVAFTQFRNTISPAFVYMSCVGNSIFDNTQSRVLSTARLSSKPGYNHFEVVNPSYVPLAMQSLRDINFVTMDLDGRKIDFDFLDESGLRAKYPTILKLHVRRIV